MMFINKLNHNEFLNRALRVWANLEKSLVVLRSLINEATPSTGGSTSMTTGKSMDHNQNHTPL